MGDATSVMSTTTWALRMARSVSQAESNSRRLSYQGGTVYTLRVRERSCCP
jgi:hypothetical protein